MKAASVQLLCLRRLAQQLTLATAFFALGAVPLVAQSADRLIAQNVLIAQTNYKGRSAIQVRANPEATNGTSYALVKDVSFLDGVIEVDLAGQPAAGASEAARGFIGIAFRVHGDGRYEYIYLSSKGSAEIPPAIAKLLDQVVETRIGYQPTIQVSFAPKRVF